MGVERRTGRPIGRRRRAGNPVGRGDGARGQAKPLRSDGSCATTPCRSVCLARPCPNAATATSRAARRRAAAVRVGGAHSASVPPSVSSQGRPAGRLDSAGRPTPVHTSLRPPPTCRRRAAARSARRIGHRLRRGGGQAHPAPDARDARESSRGQSHRARVCVQSSRRRCRSGRNHPPARRQRRSRRARGDRRRRRHAGSMGGGRGRGCRRPARSDADGERSARDRRIATGRAIRGAGRRHLDRASDGRSNGRRLPYPWPLGEGNAGAGARRDALRFRVRRGRRASDTLSTSSPAGPARGDWTGRADRGDRDIGRPGGADRRRGDIP